MNIIWDPKTSKKENQKRMKAQFLGAFKEMAFNDFTNLKLYLYHMEPHRVSVVTNSYTGNGPETEILFYAGEAQREFLQKQCIDWNMESIYDYDSAMGNVEQGREILSYENFQKNELTKITRAMLATILAKSAIALIEKAAWEAYCCS